MKGEDIQDGTADREVHNSDTNEEMATQEAHDKPEVKREETEDAIHAEIKREDEVEDVKNIFISEGQKLKRIEKLHRRTSHTMRSQKDCENSEKDGQFSKELTKDHERAPLAQFNKWQPEKVASSCAIQISLEYLGLLQGIAPRQAPKCV